ncbi:hypothetical protein LY76DRAFT_383976 [Colletotrichum caudatum]|nr:hypothetical protein LY76DRAFT_383976 [Colletotrichum caudatum]
MSSPRNPPGRRGSQEAIVLAATSLFVSFTHWAGVQDTHGNIAVDHSFLSMVEVAWQAWAWSRVAFSVVAFLLSRTTPPPPPLPPLTLG